MVRPWTGLFLGGLCKNGGVPEGFPAASAKTRVPPKKRSDPCAKPCTPTKIAPRCCPGLEALRLVPGLDSKGSSGLCDTFLFAAFLSSFFLGGGVGVPPFGWF